MNREILLNVKVDRRYGVALDIQVAQSLRSLIMNNTLHFNEELPSVHDIAEWLDVSPSDVESAYQILMKEKAVTLRNNTYQVSYYEVSNRFHQHLVTLTDAMTQMNMKPRIDTLICQPEVCTSDLAKASGFAEGEPLLRLKRVYYGDDIPLISYDAVLPLRHFPQLDQHIDPKGPYYPVLTQHYGRTIAVSNRRMKVSLLPKAEMKLFNVPNAAAAYHVVSHLYDTEGHLIEYAVSYSSPTYYFQYEHRV